MAVHAVCHCEGDQVMRCRGNLEAELLPSCRRSIRYVEHALLRVPRPLAPTRELCCGLGSYCNLVTSFWPRPIYERSTRQATSPDSVQRLCTKLPCRLFPVTSYFLPSRVEYCISNLLYNSHFFSQLSFCVIDQSHTVERSFSSLHGRYSQTTATMALVKGGFQR